MTPDLNTGREREDNKWDVGCPTNEKEQNPQQSVVALFSRLIFPHHLLPPSYSCRGTQTLYDWGRASRRNKHRLYA